MQRLPVPLRKMVSFAMLALTLMLAWIGVIAPLGAMVRNAEQALKGSQEEAQKISLTIKRLKGEIEELETADLSGAIWLAEREGALSAQVQSRLGEMARSEGVGLRSISPIPPVDLPLAEATALRIEGEATLDQFGAMLHGIEYNAPLLLVNRATIRRLARPARDSAQPQIFFQLDIVAPARLGGGAL